MELRTVNTFLHIAELHSFSRTARQLGYSQSAVSSQIAQLEAELGTPLFDRVGKTVRLTDAGQTFLGYARTLLETAQQAQAALQPAQQVRGSLRIALADSVCSTFLPGLLQRYHARCPQVELVLHTASSDEMLQLLSTNQVDLVYTLDQPLLQPTLVLAADVPEPVCFIAPPQHPLAQESVLPLDILPRQEFLLTERGMSYRDALDQCMAAHGLAIHPYLELGSAALLCQMVEQGMGLSFLPEYIVRSALAEGRLARLNVPDCTVMMHRQLFHHRDKWVTPQMNVFIELVRQGTQIK
ncbi:MAG TPA: LysR family transcriptional regulator [Faecalibacterium sp.]|nr:LysR family transcriptional regulator [Faecalibacterium sp.]